MISVFAKFPVSSQLEACTRLLDFLCALPSQAGQVKGPSKKGDCAIRNIMEYIVVLTADIQ